MVDYPCPASEVSFYGGWSRRAKGRLAPDLYAVNSRFSITSASLIFVTLFFNFFFMLHTYSIFDRTLVNTNFSNGSSLYMQVQTLSNISSFDTNQAKDGPLNPHPIC